MCDVFSIPFRIHAEFQLNEPPLFPFWFTPASFMGEIIIKKDGTHIQYFDLQLPTRKQLNIGKLLFEENQQLLTYHLSSPADIF